jgi:hypothetical protein
MAFDLLLQRETDANWSRGPSAQPLPFDFTAAERRALKMLEPSTRVHAIELIGWARQRGIPARLSSHAVIYTPEISAKHYAEGRSSINPGQIGWHHVGRAFHLVILDARKKLDKAAYARVGSRARELGGEWLGDKRIVTTKGPIEDTAHFEYHPGLDIAKYRRSPLAKTEYQRAQALAAKYA